MNDWLARALAALALLEADAPGGAWVWGPMTGVALLFAVVDHIARGDAKRLEQMRGRRR